MSEDRRALPRLETALPILAGDVRGVTRNLSAEGVLFVSPVEYCAGASIRVTLLMSEKPNERVMRVEAEGEVVRSDCESEGAARQFVTAVRIDYVRVLTDAPVSGAAPRTQLTTDFS